MDFSVPNWKTNTESRRIRKDFELTKQVPSSLSSALLVLNKSAALLLPTASLSLLSHRMSTVTGHTFSEHNLHKRRHIRIRHGLAQSLSRQPEKLKHKSLVRHAMNGPLQRRRARRRQGKSSDWLNKQETTLTKKSSGLYCNWQLLLSLLLVGGVYSQRLVVLMKSFKKTAEWME